MSSNKRKSKRPRAAQPETAKTRERKIRRLAEMTAALREGTAQYFEITRLTSLKSLCQDRDAALRFALHLAGRAQEQLQEKPRLDSVEQGEWQRYQDMAVEAVAAMRAHLESPTRATEATLYKSLSQVRESQSETVRPMGKYTVRVIHSKPLLIIENSLNCFTSPDPGYWAYQAARQYTERYDPHYGTGLIRESIPMLEDILHFWAGYVSQAEPIQETTGDPYLDIAYNQLHNIRKLYRVFAARRPVMLYDIQEQKIYAYPCREFKADMSERSQALLEDQYRRADAEGKMVVFVRDNDQRRLVSYVLDSE